MLPSLGPAVLVALTDPTVLIVIIARAPDLANLLVPCVVALTALVTPVPCTALVALGYWSSSCTCCTCYPDCSG
ncbi:hypothetical protein B0O80DRAFT_250580 [Mortierella sp. GBAus27b]|nr:hypothetical protein B0O80DRAFT_250580 [Mortierella sp. GBAus27b]